MTTTSYNIYQQITSVRVATTVNLTSNYFNGSLNNGVGATLTALSVGVLTIDAVVLEVGNRVLVKNQTNSNQNGIYVVQSAGSLSGLWMLERAPDFQSVEQLKVGQYFTVGAGATLKGSMFVLVEPLPDTIGMGTFTFIDVSDTSSPSGQFLLKAANLSDLANRETGFTNLGLGSGAFLIIDEGDFVAGLYILTNPCPNLILVNATTPGNAVRLPPVDEPESFIPSQGPVFFIDEGFQGIDVQDSTGAVISPLAAPACEQFILTSNAFPQGVWFVRSFASTVNGKSGDVVLTSSLHTIYVSNSGSDGLTADGSVLNPYATLSHALASITPSSSTPYEIVMSTGVYTEINLALKPWVYIDGSQSQLTVSSSVTLDPSWSTGGFLYFQNFFNLSWPASVILDFNAVSSPFSLLNFSNNIISSSTSLSIIGESVNGSIVLLSNNFGFSGQFSYTITNCYGSINGGASSDINIINTSDTAGGNFSIIGMTELGNTTVTTSSTSGMTFFHEESKVIGDTLYQSTGAGLLSVLEKGVTHNGDLTLDNGLGGGSTTLSASTLTFLPTLLNGATYQPDSIGDAMRANTYFIPSNYTPISGGPGSWSADSITGNLAGIDTALAGSSGNVIKQQLWVNFNDGLDTNQGGLNDPFKTYDAAAFFASSSTSPTSRFLIRIIGDNSSNIPVLYPYIDLIFTDGTFTVTGGLSLHASWDNVVNNEVVTIEGMKLNGFWSFTWVNNTGNWVRFLNCDHSLTTSGNVSSNIMSLGGIMILNDTAPQTTGYSGNLFIVQSKSYLRGAKIANEIQYDSITDGFSINHYLYDSDISFGIVLKKSFPNNSTQTVHVKNTPMPSGSPVIDDILCNVEIDTDSYLNDPTFFLTGSYANLITKGVNGIRQQIWVNAAVGNDLNNGSINAPFATYDAARTFAASKVSPTNRYLMKVIGDQTAVGDILINPYIDLDFEDCTFTSGDSASGILLDASWATVNNEKLYITGFRPVTAIGLNISWSVPANFANWLIFINSNFAQCPNGGISSAGGFGSGGNDNGIALFGSSNPLGNDFSSGLSILQVKSRIENMSFGNSVNYQIFEDDYFINHYISNCSMTGLNNARFSGNGAQSNHIRNCLIDSSISFDCQGGTVTIDSNSYSQPITLGGLNSYSDVIIYDSTDGIILNTFTPTAWSFVSGNYASNALTGHLVGINNILSGKAEAIPYQEVTSLTTVMSANNEYTANNATVVSLTLPIVASVGDTIRVNGKGAGGWRIDQQNAGHVIHAGAQTTTVGLAGSLSSATQFASITLRCITANDVWEAIATAGTYTPV